MNTPFEVTVRSAIARHLSVDVSQIVPILHLRNDLGLHPLDLVLIALRLEDMEQIDFPIEQLGSVETVGELTALFRSWIAASDFGVPLVEPRRVTPSSVEALLDRKRCA